MLLTSCVVLALADARLSLIPFTILFVGGTLIAILASVTAEMVADLHGAAPEVVGATLIATVALSSMAAGLMLWLVGRLRGGGIARYVPFQVMAGVLAARAGHCRSGVPGWQWGEASTLPC
jgi:MFS superfamily sulfate permease-like transporter